MSHSSSGSTPPSTAAVQQPSAPPPLGPAEQFECKAAIQLMDDPDSDPYGLEDDDDDDDDLDDGDVDLHLNQGARMRGNSRAGEPRPNSLEDAAALQTLVVKWGKEVSGCCYVVLHDGDATVCSVSDFCRL